MAHATRTDSQGAGAGAQWFATTHWNLVLATKGTDSAQAAEALEKLCRSYWYPLYAYVRRQGRSPEDAQDLTQGFFEHLLEKHQLRRADPQRGKFRTFLLTSLKSFLAHEWERAQTEKRGGGRTFLRWDDHKPEARYQLEAASDATPDRIYEQRWASALFQRALIRLREEMAGSGKSGQFDELKDFLASEPSDGGYAEAGAHLGLSSGSVAVAVHRLRRRYGELVREEIAHTVSTPAEIEEEMRYLVRLMSG